MDNLTDLNRNLAEQGRGLVFLIMPISAALLADFPVPQTGIVQEYLNFSEESASEQAEARVFDPRRHLFRSTATNTLLMGMIGRSPEIYVWADDWLTNLQHDPRFAQVLAHATLMTGAEMAAPNEVAPETPDDPLHGTPLAYTDDELDANEQDAKSDPLSLPDVD